MDCRRNAQVALLACLAPNVPKALGVVGWLSSKGEFLSKRAVFCCWNCVIRILPGLRCPFLVGFLWYPLMKKRWTWFGFVTPCSSRISPGEALRRMAILVKCANLNCKCYGSGGLGFPKKRKTSQMMGRPHTGWHMRSYTLVQTYLIYRTCIYPKKWKMGRCVSCLFLWCLFLIIYPLIQLFCWVSQYFLFYWQCLGGIGNTNSSLDVTRTMYFTRNLVQESFEWWFQIFTNGKERLEISTAIHPCQDLVLFQSSR